MSKEEKIKIWKKIFAQKKTNSKQKPQKKTFTIASTFVSLIQLSKLSSIYVINLVFPVVGSMWIVGSIQATQQRWLPIPHNGQKQDFVLDKPILVKRKAVFSVGIS